MAKTPLEAPLCRSSDLEMHERFDIYLVGYGISFPEHVTVETFDALSMCQKIYTNLSEEELLVLSFEFRKKFFSVTNMYREKRDRLFNYRDIADLIMQEARISSPVAWLTVGNPVVFDSVSQMLLESADLFNLKLEILPAISSIDAVTSLLGFDCANGLFIYEASGLVEARIQLHSSISTLLLQPSVFQSDKTHYTDDWRPCLRPLGKYLSAFFPGRHCCAFVRAFSRQAGAASITWSAIENIHEVPFEAIAGSSLFIPSF